MKSENSLTRSSIGPPGGKKGERRQEGGEKDEEQADAVDADVVIEPAPEPGGPLDEFGESRPAVEAEEKRQRGRERQERDGQGHRPNGPGRSGPDEDEKDGPERAAGR